MHDQLFDKSVDDLAHMTGTSQVEPEDELIEVALKVLLLNRALMGRHKPALEQGGDEVHMRKVLQRTLLITENGCDAVNVTSRLDAIVAVPVVGVDDCPRLNAVGDKANQTLAGCVRHMPQAYPTHFLPVQFDYDGYERFPDKLPPPHAGLLAAHIGLISLDHFDQPAPIRPDHGAAEFLKYQPGCLITDMQFPLQRSGALQQMRQVVPQTGRERHRRNAAGTAPVRFRLKNWGKSTYDR